MTESIAAYRRAQRLDVSFGNRINCEAQIIKSLIYLGDYRGALASQEQIDRWRREGRQPEDHKEIFYAGVARFYLGEKDQAIAAFDHAARLDAASIWSQFGQSYKAALLNDRARLLALAGDLETKDIVDGERAYRLAHFYALANDSGKALNALRRAIANGFFNSTYINRDPFLRGLHAEPEFRRLVSQAARRHKAFLNGAPASARALHH